LRERRINLAPLDAEWLGSREEIDADIHDTTEISVGRAAKRSDAEYAEYLELCARDVEAAICPLVTLRAPEAREIAHRLREHAGKLNATGLDAAANVFMSYLPNNNRATSQEDRAAAQNIISAYLRCLRPQHTPAGPARERTEEG
jgi:hypothetical protein